MNITHYGTNITLAINIKIKGEIKDLDTQYPLERR